jgi:hypothetical protein
MISTTLEYCGWIVSIVSSTVDSESRGHRVESIARLRRPEAYSPEGVITEGERNLRLVYGVGGLFSSEIHAQKLAFEAAKHGIDSLAC